MPQPPDATTTVDPRKVPGTSAIGIALGYIGDALRLLERVGAPGFDLIIRLHLAQIFFVSAVLKLADWDRALTLATYEYPVSWMSPGHAAVLGVSIELIGSILFAIGLCTRAAAIAMLALAAVIQFNYVALDENLFWIALFGWYAVHGAGARSLDWLLGRGLKDSAIPLAAPLARVNDWISLHVAPVYRLALRAWLAVAMLAAGGVGVSMNTDGLVQLLPATSATMLPVGLLLLGGWLIGTGLATRLIAVVLIAAIATRAMQDVSMNNAIYWVYCLLLLALRGAGRWSLDALAHLLLGRRYPQLHGLPAFALQGLPRVVIIGAGFGGVSCARALRHTPVSVTLIDRHNYHLFQPLLYQVATTMLAPNDIASPVRSMFREQFNVRVLLGEVSGIDSTARLVRLGSDGSAKTIPYDYLVLATGASHSYFGRDEWAPHAPGLKRIEDATEVRRRLLRAFELAESAESAAEREALLTLLIVGGGPTGVELAGAIAELARHGMEREFRHIDPATARVVLVQAAPRILPAFAEPMSETARQSLERLGVMVRLNARVEHIDAQGVVVSGERIASRTVFWAAGVIASPAAQWLGTKADPAGRVCVSPDLSVPGLAGVFAIGDTAASNAWGGKPVPGLAPAAKQGGAYVAATIRSSVLGHRPLPPFRYQHLGSLATIGRKAAIAEFGRLRLKGALAWWLWGAVHVAFLAGMRNRIAVILDWFWAYLTFRSGTRLITGDDPAERSSTHAKIATTTAADRASAA